MTHRSSHPMANAPRRVGTTEPEHSDSSLHPPTRGVADSATRVRWDALSETIRACRKCPLHRTRIQAVVYRGSLEPEVVFVGEAPGADEDRAGIPFVGRAGRLLDAGMRAVGISPTAAGVLNILKCRPPDNRFDRSAARTCRPYLREQLSLLDPRLVVTLGRWALQTLAPESPPILSAAGRAVDWEGRRLLPLLHPAATFRSRRFLDRWTSDLEVLRTEFSGPLH